eukprot:EG_transcript_3364
MPPGAADDRQTLASEPAEPAYDNGALDVYYRIQLRTERWPAALAQLRRPLPVAWRVSLSHPWAADVQAWLERTYRPWLEPIAGVPGAYHVPRWTEFTADRARQTSLEGALHQLTEAGAVFRQEKVSMLPAALLQPEPHHTVLDLCCAPGSKALHLLDLMCQWRPIQGEAPDTTDSLEAAGGLLIANDVAPARLRAVLGRVRFQPTVPLVTTCVDARRFPTLYVHGRRKLKVDRILADVPCTGDGTLRKNPHIWFTWDVLPALQLHPTQVDILARGLKLLAFGGRLVYSTCTLDPIQDEAVVAAALRAVAEECPTFRCELLPIPTMDEVAVLPGLRRWVVPDPDFVSTGTVYDSFDAVPEQAPRRRYILPSMFPPPEDLPLHRCVRVLPTDSGGFFLALFTKRRPGDAAEPSQSEGSSPLRQEDPAPPSPLLDQHLLARLRDTPAHGLRRGAAVLVRATGYPGVIESRGGGRYAGLFKVVYDDGTHYHCHPRDLVPLGRASAAPRPDLSPVADGDPVGPNEAADPAANPLAVAEEEGHIEAGVDAAEVASDGPAGPASSAAEPGSPSGLNDSDPSMAGQRPAQRLHFKRLLPTLATADAELNEVVRFYGLLDDAAVASQAGRPRFPRECVTVGSGGIRLVPPHGPALLVSQRNREARLRVFASGLLLFLPSGRDDGACRWRPSTEAAGWLSRRATRRVLVLPSTGHFAPVLAAGRLAGDALLTMAAAGTLAGWEACCEGPGGAVVPGPVIIGVCQPLVWFVDAWLDAAGLQLTNPAAHRQAALTFFHTCTAPAALSTDQCP